MLDEKLQWFDYKAFDATTRGKRSVQHDGEQTRLYEGTYCVYNQKLKNIYEDFIKIGLLLCLCLQKGYLMFYYKQSELAQSIINLKNIFKPQSNVDSNWSSCM